MAFSLNWSPAELFDKLYSPLQFWLEQHGIAYPWSQDLNCKSTLPDSYAVWISEVMLQQTRVQTVEPYYLAWLERWPSLADLAGAREQEVLKLWEGLGYYNRAINLHKCAQSMCAQNETALPSRAAQLKQLPGIGGYIAAAIASISHNEAILALDTNVRRILSRLYQCQPSLEMERLWQGQHQEAIALCSWRGSANISLIQLGQQLCRAKNPQCGQCPLRDVCPGQSNWAEFPQVTKRAVHKIASQRILCLVGTESLVLMQNRSGHLKHLWRFPTRKDLAEALNKEDLPSDEYLGENNLAYLGSFQHAYLQTREKVEVFRVEIAGGLQKEWQTANTNWHLATRSEMQQLTLAGPYRKFYRERC